ncbi:MAG TPA: hypothetical protein VEY50_04755 [Lysobacter sp.]|nr:hypothetical protein [Lysobacter sp.]
MDMRELLLPMIFAASAAPLFVIAGMVSRGRLHLIAGLDAARVRDPDSLARRLATLLAAVGFSVMLGGVGLLWAGADRDRMLAVVLAMLVAVNGLAIALFVAVARAKRDYRPPRR